jgi:hypothetical protein
LSASSAARSATSCSIPEASMHALLFHINPCAFTWTRSPPASPRQSCTAPPARAR